MTPQKFDLKKFVDSKNLGLAKKENWAPKILTRKTYYPIFFYPKYVRQGWGQVTPMQKRIILAEAGGVPVITCSPRGEGLPIPRK